MERDAKDTVLLPPDGATKDTVGKLSSELLQQDVYGDITAGDQMQEQLRDYERFLFECLASGKNQYAADFYVVVVTKRERLMPNVFRNYFISRQSCPTPNYDQTVYKYHRKDDHLEFLWTLPSVVGIKNMLEHRHHLDPSLYTLLRFVLEFSDGSLDKKAQLFNNEEMLDVRSKSNGAHS